MQGAGNGERAAARWGVGHGFVCYETAYVCLNKKQHRFQIILFNQIESLQESKILQKYLEKRMGEITV